jgi:hypothetical protein
MAKLFMLPIALPHPATVLILLFFPAGVTAAQIQGAINGIGQMDFLAAILTPAQIRDLAAYITAPF